MEQRSEERCPFLNTPFEDCYVRDLDSLEVESAIRYCGGEFKQCDIYVRHLTEGPEGVHDGILPKG